jgi:serine/threonine protein kinase/Tol biopolymer transport system component
VPAIERHLVRFEGFELDVRTGELRKDGKDTIRFSEQPLRILVALLERPRELVLREDLRKRLWPNDTVVEFEHSINAAMKRLRQALGDSAENPQFIETLTRRGYRWKTTVEWVAAPAQTSRLPAISADQNLVGTRVSHYRVLEVLGGGGMGLVYKAEDLKLGRRVALKFLPGELAADPVALERFRREARAASMPDHPNICTIYEVGEHEGTPFIAMQMLQGQTLSERIEAGARVPLALEEVLSIASQVADGLDAAHREGVIHRDVKPANIFVTSRGEAKILDFGLAKIAEIEGLAEVACGQPATNREAHPYDLTLTRIGATIGTASYMSPEQARGEKLDVRTDLFSFGLVLYEMSTGERAFPRGSASDVHDAVLHQTPTPVQSLNPKVPSELQAVIDKSLRKDREYRYQTASELRSDLERLRKELGFRSLGSDQAPPSRARFSRPLLYMAGLLVLLLVVGSVWTVRRGQPLRPALKLTQLTWNSSEIPVRTAAISPDGKYLAYTDLNGIHIKILSSNETRTVPQPDSVRRSGRVDWSVIAWFPEGTRFIAQIAPFGEGCVGCDPFSTWVVSALGGPPRKIRDQSAAESISPDGTLIAFTAILGKPGGREIWVMGAAGEHARKLFGTGPNSWMRYARWSPDGQRLAYVHVHETPTQNSTLESRPLNGGSPVAILANANAVHDYVWLDGNLVYSLEEPGGNACNYWKLKVDTRTGRSEGQPKKITNWAGFCLDEATVTADGKRLVFTEPQERGAIYVAQLQQGGASTINIPKRLSLIEAANDFIGWTTDSKSVVFASNRDGAWGFYKQALGSDNAELIVTGLMNWYGSSVTPDGRWILYLASNDNQDQSRRQRLVRVPMGGGPSEEVLTGQLWGIRCARLPSDICVLKEWSSDYKQLIFSAVGPMNGRGRELFRMDATDDTNWDLSPDGTRLALFGVDKPIRIKSLADHTIREVAPKGWNGMDYVTWAHDSDGLYGSSPTQQGDVLLHMNLQGKVHVVWEHRGSLTTLGVPSPDGRQIAMRDWSLSSNVWMMENF